MDPFAVNSIRVAAEELAFSAHYPNDPGYCAHADWETNCIRVVVEALAPTAELEPEIRTKRLQHLISQIIGVLQEPDNVFYNETFAKRTSR